jgi:mutator protein MutT
MNRQGKIKSYYQRIMPSPKSHIHVTAAMILSSGRVLLARRPPESRHGGKWEFPGGKQEPGEDLESCLKREIMEELGVDIVDLNHLESVYHDYSDFSLTLHGYTCRLRENTLQAVHGQDINWVIPEKVLDYDILPPDRTLTLALIKLNYG